MKKAVFATILMLTLCGCRPSTDQIGEQVKVLLQEKLDQEPAFKKYNLVVSRVDVMREDGNKYRGIATVVMNGVEHSVTLVILADNDQIMYEADPKSFFFVLQQPLVPSGQSANSNLNLMSHTSNRNADSSSEQKGAVIGEFDSSSH